MSLRVLVNPTAGHGKAGAAVAVVEPRVGRENIVVTKGVEHLRHEAWRAADEGLERLLVAGGDGTMHWAVQELAGSKTALAVLPLGSGNDLAATLGMPSDLRAALEIALSAPIREMDLGKIADRYFALYCGIGFDGEVSKTYNEKVRWLRGTAGYVWAAIRAMMRFRPPTLTLEFPGGRIEQQMMLAVAANAPRCGGGMQIAPMATIDSGRFELVYLDAVGRMRLLQLLGKVFSGDHIGHPRVHHESVSELRVSADRKLWVYGDGEPLLELEGQPLLIEMHQRALRVVTP